MKLINSIQIVALTILTSSLSFAQTSPTGTAPTVGTTTNAKGNTTTTTQAGGGTNKVTTDVTTTTQKNGTTVLTSKTVDPVTGKTTFSKNATSADGLTLESSTKTITTPTKSK